jgi:K+-sensing histidine kinase KdpD
MLVTTGSRGVVMVNAVIELVLSGRRRRALVLTLSVAAPVLVCAVSSALRDLVSSTSAALVLVLCVVVAGTSGQRVAAFLAAAAGGVSFDYFLTQPFHQLAIADPDDVEVTVLLIVIGVIVTEVTMWGFRQQARAARRSGYLDGALKAAENAARRDMPTPTLFRFIAAQIAEILGAPSCRFVMGPVHDARLAVLDHDGSVTRNGRVLDVEREGLPVDEETAIEVRRGSETIGHFVITSASAVVYPTAEQRRVAVLLADQVSAGLSPSAPPR